MPKIYIKIFIGFWAINILTVVGHNIYVHWVNPSPENQLLAQYESSPYDRFAVRGLNSTIDAIMDYNLASLRRGIPQVDEWIFRRVYIVDELGIDLRGREIPPIINEILGMVGPKNPFYITSEQEQSYAARFILLPDGNELRVISFSTPLYGRYVQWRLYIRSNWVLYLMSLLISGTACYIFARHLSRDFRALQEATNEIARGDLTVRVAPRFATRKDEMADLSRDFDNMTVRLQKSMQEQKRLIKDVSHELRSPLARLQFALGIAQQRSGGKVQEELEKARHAADYLNDIITTILSFPTNEAESWELTDMVDLNALLQTLETDFVQEASEKGVTITFKSDVQDALVATYSNTLMGVFENLIGNAVHYTRPDTLITISLRQRANDFIIAVADQGPGVKEEQLRDIFEPFFRTDEARDRASGGYGLGLSIAQRTVQLHQGSITAHNHPEGGLVVEVLLPRADFESTQESEYPAPRTA
ncbi:ATP-binding protein [Gilvimarinus sp. F26214L]|uniref:ATP-binding protein n=1 Tax=Gilvimarinus sp. DZF01 TaxID=3461371 RepID=UPI004045D1A6